MRPSPPTSQLFLWEALREPGRRGGIGPSAPREIPSADCLLKCWVVVSASFLRILLHGLTTMCVSIVPWCTFGPFPPFGYCEWCCHERDRIDPSPTSRAHRFGSQAVGGNNMPYSSPLLEINQLEVTEAPLTSGGVP